jgi:hypothetical protein
LTFPPADSEIIKLRFLRKTKCPGSKNHSSEALAKLLKAVESRHSGQAKRDPESRIFKRFWIPAPAPDPDPGFAGMTE